MADLFLSFSPKDAELAHKIAHSLESKGSSVFFDRQDSVSTEALQLLDHEMGQASWVIVLWSRNALEDGRITYEAMHAREKNNLLSVQIEPNSIPTEYSNDGSPDHVNYQNQLNLIVQQALSPESEASPTIPEQTQQAAPQDTPVAPNLAQQPTQAEENQVQTAQMTTQPVTSPSTNAGSAQPVPTVKAVQENNPQQVVADQNPPQQSQNQTVSSESQNKAQPVEQQPVEQSPRQNLQQKLAQSTQTTASPQVGGVAPQKMGQPAVNPSRGAQVPVNNPAIRRDIPQTAQTNVVNSATHQGQPVTPLPTATAPVVAAQKKTSKFVPVALMSVGTLILASVGGGYWFLANNSPQSAIKSASPKNYKILKAAKAPVTRAVKVAAVKVVKPRTQVQPSVAAKKASTSPVDDDILNSLIASSAPRKPAQPAPAPTPVVPQKVAKQVAVLTSAERGAKSISQCLGCHSFKKGAPNKSGPNLHGVMNQLIGSERKFNYSDTLRSMGAIGEVWSKEQLDCYLKNPAVCMPGTKMGFNGIKGHKKRNDIIAYLQTLKQ